MASVAAIKNWDIDVDVLVCGFGAAGASAAIEAHDTDPSAKILILEKAPEEHAGGNARVSGQSLLISNNAQALAEYQRKMSIANPIPEDLLRPWAERMTSLELWIRALAETAGQEFLVGTGFTEREAVLEFPDLGARDAVTYTATILPIPSGVWLALKANVEKRGVPVRFGTRLVDLIQDPDSLEVYGAVVEERGVRRIIRARRAVILATGGFEANLQMQRDYFGFADAYPLGTPYNEGDGLKILQKAGAEMWHLRNQGQSGGVWPGIAVPGQPTVHMRNFLLPAFSWFDVDAEGRRFYGETGELQLTHYKVKRHGRYIDSPLAVAGPIHMIFDEATRTAGKLVMEVMTWSAIVSGYQWSEDNEEELRAGILVRADSIEELAARIGKNTAIIAEEIERYNGACAVARDEAFGRPPDTLIPLNGPPFYAVEVKPAIVCTGGGARRNIESEVLDWDGRPIRRLYEAGELGSMFSDLYQNGSYLTEAMISGRAAGANAVRLPAWERDLEAAE